MLPKELAKKIRYIQIFTSKAVNDVLAGEYHSVFKGRGMEFEEVREYSPGDEIRSIDWNVTARTGEPFVKRYREERELTVLLAVDLSGSGRFGSRERLKNEAAAEICALLAFSAVKNNDKVGLLIFTSRIELFIPPAKGTSHVLRVIRELLEFEPRERGTDIAGALTYVNRVWHRRAVVFLVSDFRDSDFAKPLRISSRRHDLIAVELHDIREEELPDIGLVEFVDSETGRRELVDTSSRRVRERFRAVALERRGQLRDLMRRTGVGMIEATTSEDYVRDLVRFFRRRERRAA